MTASSTALVPASGGDDAAVLRGEVQEQHCAIEKPTEIPESQSKPTPANHAASGSADLDHVPGTHSCMTLKLKELNKRQRKKLKELNKTFAEKSKVPEKAAEAMRLAAEAAIKEQTKLAQSEIEMEVAKKEAVEALANTDAKLAQSKNLVNQLKDLCRELQHQSQQYASDNEKIRTEEARKRKEAADEVSAVLENLSERLNKQSEDVMATNQENTELRGQLAKVSEVLTLSDEIRSKYEAECTRLSTEADGQKQLAESAMKQLQESEQKSMAYAKRILELQEATQKASDAIKSCHSTNIQLSQEKKEVLALNQTIRDEYTKAAKLLTCSIEDNKAKASQIQKLQLAVQRLESLCRHLQDQIRASREESSTGSGTVPSSQYSQDQAQLTQPVQVMLDCSGDFVKLSLIV